MNKLKRGHHNSSYLECSPTSLKLPPPMAYYWILRQPWAVQASPCHLFSASAGSNSHLHVSGTWLSQVGSSQRTHLFLLGCRWKVRCIMHKCKWMASRWLGACTGHRTKSTCGTLENNLVLTFMWWKFFSYNECVMHSWRTWMLELCDYDFKQTD